MKSLPTASLRALAPRLLETIARVRLRPDAVIYLISRSTGGLDARLLLTPDVDLDTRIDAESWAARVLNAGSRKRQRNYSVW